MMMMMMFIGPMAPTVVKAKRSFWRSHKSVEITKISNKYFASGNTLILTPYMNEWRMFQQAF